MRFRRFNFICYHRPVALKRILYVAQASILSISRNSSAFYGSYRYSRHEAKYFTVSGMAEKYHQAKAKLYYWQSQCAFIIIGRGRWFSFIGDIEGRTAQYHRTNYMPRAGLKEKTSPSLKSTASHRHMAIVPSRHDIVRPIALCLHHPLMRLPILRSSERLRRHADASASSLLRIAHKLVVFAGRALVKREAAQPRT